MMIKRLLGVFLSMLVFTTIVTATGTGTTILTILYVKQGSQHIQNGKSWETAFSSVQDALAAAESGQEIWVTQGIYYPTEGTDRKISFELKEGVVLYGGFAGTETSRNQRDWKTNITILSGDIGIPNDMTDNSQHVVIGADHAIIDGFTVRDGYSIPSGPPRPGPGGNMGPPPEGANPGGSMKPPPGGDGGPQGPSTTPEALMSQGISLAGAGMVNFQTAPVVRNVIFSNNQATKGGAVYNINPGGTAPVFINVTFSGNSAMGRGGAMSNDMMTNPLLINVRFLNNRCDDKGGALYNDFGCSPTIINALFAGNQADTAAAMGNDGESSPRIFHATFVDNVANEAGSALYQGSYKADEANRSNRPTIINSIIWGNTVSTFGSSAIYNWGESAATISYSLIEGGYPGTGNFDADPLFNDRANGDYSLSAKSPAIDAGTTEDIPLHVDINGLPRVKGYDLGTFEWGTEADTPLNAADIQTLAADTVASDRPKPAGRPEGKDGGVKDAWEGLGIQAEAEDFDIPGHVVYVNGANSTGPWDGMSWLSAYQTVQDGIDAAAEAGGGEVWIASGLYMPADTGDRSSSITLQEHVALYGGFNGTESNRDERDLEINTTILSGNIGDPKNATDNAYHVVTGTSYAILDGLTISDGYADGEYMHRHGGGILNYTSVSSLTINHVTFTNNYAINGGAMYNFYFGFVVITNSVFTDNHADYGGALYSNVAASGSIVDTVFQNNSATYRGGAVVIDYGSANTFSGVSFVNNSTEGKGGAVWTDTRAAQTDFSAPIFDNCTFSNNRAHYSGGAVHNYNQTIMTITNSTFSGNSAEYGEAIANELKGTLLMTNNTFGSNSRHGDTDVYSDESSTINRE